MDTVALPVPLFDSDLYLALRQVQRGRIGAFGKDGVLCAAADELAPGVFVALLELQRDGFLAVGQEDPRRPTWYPIALSEAGVKLLRAWLGRSGRAEDAG